MKAVLPIALVFLAGARTGRRASVGGGSHAHCGRRFGKRQADFCAMGFAIKGWPLPCRRHSQRSCEIPGRHGTELMTAPRPTDSLTTEYYAKEQRGDGPVYFGLWASNYSSLVARILALGAPVEQDGDLLTFPWPIRSIHCSSALARNLPRIVRSISPTLIRRSGCQAFGCGVINRSVTCWPGWACRWRFPACGPLGDPRCGGTAAWRCLFRWWPATGRRGDRRTRRS